MTSTPDGLRSFLARNGPAALVTISTVQGSVPREAGAWMLVAPGGTFGTIGGGRLEMMAMERARTLLAGSTNTDRLDIPLGPEIGQCCGGRVTLDLARMTQTVADSLFALLESEVSAQPHVHLFGAGHVGRALANALDALPLRITMVETRPEMVDDLPEGITTRLSAVPEEIVAAAPPGSAFVVLTHDHALDFLIARAALERGDAAYVGMIGSETKRATFESQYRRGGGDEKWLTALTCPIGAKLSDKRPEVIAALVAAELLDAFATRAQTDTATSRGCCP